MTKISFTNMNGEIHTIQLFNESLAAFTLDDLWDIWCQFVGSMDKLERVSRDLLRAGIKQEFKRRGQLCYECELPIKLGDERRNPVQPQYAKHRGAC